MYNEQMESLISAALADGVLTEKEKQILFKKAESMGIDLDEFEMVLDARLVELKKKEAREAEQHELEMEKAKAAQKSAPKSNKYGDVRKCPACGAIVESFQTKCPECGYEFTNIEANSTTKQLVKKLEEIDAHNTSSGIFHGAAKFFGEDSGTEKKAQIIRTFPIPNTKEDLLEMISLSHANSEASQDSSTSEDKIASAWQEKYKQLILKAQITLRNDPDFQYFLSEIENAKKKAKKENIRTNIIAFAGLIAIILLGLIISLIHN